MENKPKPFTPKLTFREMRDYITENNLRDENGELRDGLAHITAGTNEKGEILYQLTPIIRVEPDGRRIYEE